MQIYSVLIKIWKLQIDLLCMKKKTKTECDLGFFAHAVELHLF